MTTSVRPNQPLSSYKKNDSYHLTYTITDFALMWGKENPEGMSEKKFKQINYDFFAELRTAIIEKRYRFSMPYRLGVIRIIKKKSPTDLKKKRIDYKKSEELGQTVYYLNLHTNRYYFRWKWEKPRQLVTFKNNTFFSFKPVRKATRELSYYINECSVNPELRDYDCLS